MQTARQMKKVIFENDLRCKAIDEEIDDIDREILELGSKRKHRTRVKELKLSRSVKLTEKRVKQRENHGLRECIIVGHFKIELPPIQPSRSQRSLNPHPKPPIKPSRMLNLEEQKSSESLTTSQILHPPHIQQDSNQHPRSKPVLHIVQPRRVASDDEDTSAEEWFESRPRYE